MRERRRRGAKERLDAWDEKPGVGGCSAATACCEFEHNWGPSGEADALWVAVKVVVLMIYSHLKLKSMSNDHGVSEWGLSGYQSQIFSLLHLTFE